MRLFIAVDLAPAVLDETRRSVERLRRLAPEVKWANPEGLHVTLAFLGEVPDEQRDDIERVVREVASSHAPLTLRARGGGGFGTKRHPRVLWVGLDGEVDALGRIQAALAAALQPLGFEPESRPFKPHLTIARAREPRGDEALARCVEALAKADFGESRIGSVVLYRSQLSPKGAKYTPLLTAPLGG